MDITVFSSPHSWATKLHNPSLSWEKMNKPQTTGVKHLIAGFYDLQTIIDALEGAKQPLVSDKNKYFFPAANGPDKMCIPTHWRRLFFKKNSNSTDHLCNILWGLCQSGRSRWKVDTHSFCRLSHCPDSWQQRIFFPLLFLGRGFLAAYLSVSICSLRTDDAPPLAPAWHTLTGLQRRDRGAETGRGCREDGAGGGQWKEKSSKGCYRWRRVTVGKGVQLGGWRMWCSCGCFGWEDRTDPRRWPPSATRVKRYSEEVGQVPGERERERRER